MVRLCACYWTAKQDSSVIHRIQEEVVNSDRLLEMEFDKNSLRGVLDTYQWYPTAMDQEYGPRCKWNCDKKMIPRINDVKQR